MNAILIILSIINVVLLTLLLVRVFGTKNENAQLERMVREESASNRQELSKNFEGFSKQFLTLTQMNEDKLEKVRDVVEKNLRSLQDDNTRQLERMRETVDEKLHATLEKRLGESFQVVSDRLEKVHQGLGEMQNLASGVGDLKRVLSNVKTRGILGEIQLENILEQILSPQQYEKNVVTKEGSRDPVEFAIKLPGKDKEHHVYLPIDSKFPIEDYERLQQALEDVNLVEIEATRKSLESRIKLEAKKIQDKYIDPPNTTDFGIMFLPTEGLYAEVLRKPGFFNTLQKEFKIIVAGPTTVSALLNSLQMGFRTLAVEKRASEVWNLLGDVKKEFVKFGDILDKTQTRLQQAGKEIELATKKSRTIERKLRNVQEIPQEKKKEITSPIEAVIEGVIDDEDSI